MRDIQSPKWRNGNNRRSVEITEAATVRAYDHLLDLSVSVKMYSAGKIREHEAPPAMDRVGSDSRYVKQWIWKRLPLSWKYGLIRFRYELLRKRLFRGQVKITSRFSLAFETVIVVTILGT